MVAALQLPLSDSQIETWIPQTERERHVSIVIAMWRCYTDNNFWPDLKGIAETTEIPPSIASTDLLVLIHQGYVKVHKAGYKLIVRREV